MVRENLTLRRRLASLLLAGSVALTLPACSAAPAGGGNPTPTEPSMATPPTPANGFAGGGTPAAAPIAATPTTTETGCNAQVVQDLVGRHTSGLIAEGARQRAGAQRVRMIGDDEMVTKEYDAGRLNLQLDAQGRVARVYCG